MCDESCESRLVYWIDYIWISWTTLVFARLPEPRYLSGLETAWYSQFTRMHTLPWKILSKLPIKDGPVINDGVKKVRATDL